MKYLLFVLILLHLEFIFSQDANNLITRFGDYVQERPVEKIYLHIDKPYYMAGGLIYMRAYLTNAHLDTNVTSRIIYVELSDMQRRQVKRTLLYSDKQEFAGQIQLPDSLPAANYHLRAYTNWMRNAGEEYFFHRDIFIGSAQGEASISEQTTAATFDYHISFFPEGGQLIAGTENRVAFKALGNDGFGTDVTGIVRDDAGNEIARIASTHMGMGRFTFVPQRDRTYHVSTISRGIQKERVLPETVDDGMTLSISRDNDFLFVRLVSAGSNQEPFSIIGQSRQTICYALQGVLKTDEQSIAVPKEKFPTGIAHFTLFRNNLPVSERLVFIDRNDDLKIELTPDKENYGDREKAAITIQVTDKDSQPVQGSFSLSVTDDKVVMPSADRFNIKGSLLLESDLKGHIENPGWYFAGDEPEREEALDILLSTQGWSRFSWEAIEKDNSPLVYPVEDEFKIAGRLVNALGKPVKDGTVLMLSTVGTDIPEAALTDKDGRFGFIGFNNPDTTVIALQGRNKRENRFLLDIRLDDPDNKAPLFTIPLTRIPSSSTITPETPSPLFMEQASLQKKYDESLWMIDLPEVEVLDKKAEQKKREMMWSSMTGRKLTRENINDRNSVWYEMRRLGKEPIMLMIDGIRIDVIDRYWKNYLETTRASNFESIELVTGIGTSMWGAMGDVPIRYGIFILKSRVPEGRSPDMIHTPGLLVYKPEGYCVRREFYLPEYDKPEVRQNSTPDFRTTIYWNPVVNTDSEGKATVQFYTSDNVKTYSFVLEGMGANKIGCSY